MARTGTYRSIAAPAGGELKDRGSKFLAYAAPVQSEADVQAHLAAVRKLHNKARHHCYAYRLGTDGNSFRANDDGEPSGTAGRPILGQLDSFDVTDVCIVVVRYFGGTLLGASGLIRAYRGAAALALEDAEIVEHTVRATYRITFDYARTGALESGLDRIVAQRTGQRFGARGQIDIALPIAEAEATLHRLKAYLLGREPNNSDAIDDVPGVEIERMGE